jgi:hypothetical protein
MNNGDAILVKLKGRKITIEAARGNVVNERDSIPVREELIEKTLIAP